MPNVQKDPILLKSDTVLQSRWFSPFWRNISLSSSESLRVQDSCRMPTRVQQQSWRTLNLVRRKQCVRTNFPAIHHHIKGEWNYRLHFCENLKALKRSQTDAAQIGAIMRHAERYIGLVWNFNNLGKTSQPLFHSTFHTSSFYGAFSDAVIVYLYSVSGKLINMNMRDWWMFLSLIILQQWTLKWYHTIKEILQICCSFLAINRD